MFEVGKKYKSLNTNKKYLFVRPYSGTAEAGYFNRNGEEFFMRYALLDPTPIDDTPVPRMVTTCDIGARVVRGRDWGYGTDASQGGENAVGTIIENATGGNCWVLWDNGIKHIYRIGENGRYDLYYADEQPKKEESIIGEKEFRQAVEIIEKAQPKKEIAYECERCGNQYETRRIHICIPKDKQANPAQEYAEQLCKLYQESIEKKIDSEYEKIISKDDKDTDKTPPDPAPGIASIMFGSKPRLMYGSLAQIQGPTKDEEARNARTEEERKRYV